MNVAVSAEAQGIGFAIPSSTIKEVVEYLKNNQEGPKEPVPFIGANLGTVTPQIAQSLGTDVTEGTYVDSVVFRSPQSLDEIILKLREEINTHVV